MKDQHRAREIIEGNLLEIIDLSKNAKPEIQARVITNTIALPAFRKTLLTFLDVDPDD